MISQAIQQNRVGGYSLKSCLSSGKNTIFVVMPISLIAMQIIKLLKNPIFAIN
jgi:tRNA A37 threonylcarbamoyladenosine synthetase subunit TsaC/SUA5/YrdC